VTGISITLKIGLAGLTAVSIEMGGVFGYDEVPQRAGITVYGFKWEMSGHAQ